MTSFSLLGADAGSDTDQPPLFAVAHRQRERRWHRHARGQLVGAASGPLAVEAGGGHWLVPANCAVWIPPGIAHAVRARDAAWNLYVAPSACAALPRETRILAVSGLLREALARAMCWRGNVPDAAQARLGAVIIDEISAPPAAPGGLSMPREPRLLKIAQALAEDPADPRRIGEWAAWAAITPRTLTRRFVAETGFSFSAWRQRARLLRALEMLAARQSVTAVALDLGYDNVSAFIALFRRVYGTTPGQYAALAAIA
ncbi:AraC family transcriptional regulator [Pseudoduganella sp. R-34]|uniref:AraC family transcriptional regulator n=1 Tax=Pseudoduganella sp. R-34 TaxID=3404062 RepID=UPI003CFB1968